MEWARRVAIRMTERISIQFYNTLQGTIPPQFAVPRRAVNLICILTYTRAVELICILTYTTAVNLICILTYTRAVNLICILTYTRAINLICILTCTTAVNLICIPTNAKAYKRRPSIASRAFSGRRQSLVPSSRVGADQREAITSSFFTCWD